MVSFGEPLLSVAQAAKMQIFFTLLKYFLQHGVHVQYAGPPVFVFPVHATAQL